MSRSEKVCREIMQRLVEEGYTYSISQTTLEKAIIYVRGPDKRTLKNWRNALLALGFLKGIAPFTFEMNLKKCPELLVSMLKGDNQKKLM